MTWDLILQSFAVLRRDRKLLLFPIFSALAAVAVSLPFFWGRFGGKLAGIPQSPNHWLDHWSAASYAALFLWYCAGTFVMIFFNCALAACAQIRFGGGEPTVTEGLILAWKRVGSILWWAVLSSTVGVIIRAIEDRAGWIGRIIIGFVGIGWSLATYLIVPVLVLEERDAIGSLRRSGELFRKTWGEQLVSGIHFGWMSLVFAIPGVILGAVAWPVGILYFVALAAVMTAAREVFVVALYRYAVSGEAPDGYSTEAMNGAFRKR